MILCLYWYDKNAPITHLHFFCGDLQKLHLVKQTLLCISLLDTKVSDYSENGEDSRFFKVALD